MEAKIGYDYFKIILEKAPTADDGVTIVDGNFSQQDNKIAITTEVGVRRQKQILLHEINHGLSDIFDLDLTEKQIDTLSLGMLMFIWDNPKLIDLIQEEMKPLE